MSTEDDARVRQVLRMAQQLPEPDWNLFARATKKFSRAGQPLKGRSHQKRVGKPMRKYQSKKKEDGNTIDQSGQKR